MLVSRKCITGVTACVACFTVIFAVCMLVGHYHGLRTHARVATDSEVQLFVASSADIRVLASRIDSVTQSKLMDRWKARDARLSIVIAANVPVLDATEIITLARHKGFPEARVVFSNLTIDELCEPFEVELTWIP